MAILITGGTGFIGSYATTWLLRNTDHELALLVRAPDYDAGVEHLWKALQLHMQADEFYRALERVCFIRGDLSRPNLGISAQDYDWLISNAESILHNGAALNFRSERACTNHNLKGTLAVVQLARAIHEDHPLRRFTLVSTAAVAGVQAGETILESSPLDWGARDFNPYTRSKKFCEHMVRELLPDVPKLFLRPSMVIGDSRFPETTQFEMVRAFCTFSDLPFLPFQPDTRFDVVNADWAGPAIAELHVRADISHQVYHLTSGAESRSLEEISEALAASLGKPTPRFIPGLRAPSERVASVLANLERGGALQRLGALMSVLIPYIGADMAYDNSYAVEDLGHDPVPFTTYGADLYHYAKSVNYAFPYRPLPQGLDLSNVPPSPVRPMA